MEHSSESKNSLKNQNTKDDVEPGELGPTITDFLVQVCIMLLANISARQISSCLMQMVEQKLYYSKKSSILDVKYHRRKK